MAEKKVTSEKKIVATAGIYDILRRPIISEKAAKLSESNGVAFEVAIDATKEDVARAVEAIYGVKPTKKGPPMHIWQGADFLPCHLVHIRCNHSGVLLPIDKLGSGAVI